MREVRSSEDGDEMGENSGTVGPMGGGAKHEHSGGGMVQSCGIGDNIGRYCSTSVAACRDINGRYQANILYT
ncbi:UNVERIFIED_CONTAM: hypothetical protein Slati_0387700 [Sesamum latifolium]|uniref:Uncharacterized protein n=1 Tax=Sesamum latifolium TaxID=2727402 RepID=A0AAW2XZW2_9LAMI